MGYSDKRADLIAHYASTYADNPKLGIRFLDYATHPGDEHYQKSGGMHLAPNRPGIDYEKTKDSQDESNSHWHGMMSDEEAANGMTKEQAVDRALAFGWDNIFGSDGGKDLGKVGQGFHALQDVEAHGGAKTSDHLGKNWSSVKMGVNDLYGATSKAYQVTKSAAIVLNLLEGNKVSLKVGDRINTAGMSAQQVQNLRQMLKDQGYTTQTKRY